MRFIKSFKILPLILLIAVLSLGADSGAKTKPRANSLRVVQMNQVTPLGSNLTLPAGPRTGQFYLNRGFSNGVHNLGILKKGQKLTVFVEHLTAGFDPVALIIAPDWAKKDVAVWQADDNGDDPDPAFSITIPVTGTYTMLISEFSGKPGWYRYRMEVD